MSLSVCAFTSAAPLPLSILSRASSPSASQIGLNRRSPRAGNRSVKAYMQGDASGVCVVRRTLLLSALATLLSTRAIVGSPCVANAELIYDQYGNAYSKDRECPWAAKGNPGHIVAHAQDYTRLTCF